MWGWNEARRSSFNLWGFNSFPLFSLRHWRFRLIFSVSIPRVSFADCLASTFLSLLHCSPRKDKKLNFFLVNLSTCASLFAIDSKQESGKVQKPKYSDLCSIFMERPVCKLNTNGFLLMLPRLFVREPFHLNRFDKSWRSLIPCHSGDFNGESR